MLDRIENLRRLKEQCEKRARLLRTRHDYAASAAMERWAGDLANEVASLTASQAMASFAARVEGDGPPAIDPHGYPCCDCGRVYHGDTCPGCGHGEDVALANEYQERD